MWYQLVDVIFGDVGFFQCVMCGCGQFFDGMVKDQIVLYLQMFCCVGGGNVVIDIKQVMIFVVVVQVGGKNVVIFCCVCVFGGFQYQCVCVVVEQYVGVMVGLVYDVGKGFGIDYQYLVCLI